MTKEELLSLKIDLPDREMYSRIKDNWNRVAKPLDGLGVMESIICTIGAVQNTERPELSPRALVIMCADNGVVKEGISQSGQEVTLAVAYNMGRKESSVCKMCKTGGIDVIPVDIGINSGETVPGVRNMKVAPGTRDLLEEPAMKETEVLAAIEAGIKTVGECAEKGYRILATGEMGIGNTTTSTILAAAFTGLSPERITGRGAGLTDKGLSRKVEVIKAALKKYPVHDDAFEMLRCAGGLDIAGLCGVFIGGALYHVPVVIDGVISAVAALCAEMMVPGCKEYMLASHRGKEPAMGPILERLGQREIIHAELALGEGTGAVMLFPLLDMAITVYNESSSFDNIGVEQYTRYN